MKQKIISVKGIKFCNDLPVKFLAGPCVIETDKLTVELAGKLVKIFKKHKVKFVFKASLDKANRTSVNAFRGTGLSDGLKTLEKIKNKFHIPIITDIHEPWQAEEAASVCDILQIPAFLCRQTDLVMAAAATGKVVNIKKGQFLSPQAMAHIIKKVESCGNKKIMITERGSSFGYGDLVVDMRSLEILKDFGYPVIFDCTHSVQKPPSTTGKTGGDSRFASVLAKSATAVGVSGMFFEVAKMPKLAKSDAANSLDLKQAENLVKNLAKLDKLVKNLK